MSHEFRELFINELYKSFSEIEISKTDYSELDTEEKQINKLLELLEEIKEMIDEMLEEKPSLENLGHNYKKEIEYKKHLEFYETAFSDIKEIVEHRKEERDNDLKKLVERYGVD